MNFKHIWRESRHKPMQNMSILLLRLWLAQEFLYAAFQKLMSGMHPPSWFATLDFPWPLIWLGPQLNWLAASYGELLFGLALVAGIFTRMAALGLLFITYVAVYTVHFDLGWAGWRLIETDAGNGFKVPLMMGLMLFILAANGAGEWSLDGMFKRDGPGH